jgi:hypothetical protein
MLITTGHDHHDVAADAVVLRTAGHTDGAALRALAALDDAAPLAGAVLVAEQDGALRAAISLHSGRVVADPFHRSADLVTLLRARAAALAREPRRARRATRLFRRPARAA